ncbi:MAG TPA: alpha/beta hydrolase-fold protein [Solimonas sp.]
MTGEFKALPLPVETMFRRTRYFEIDSVKAGARYAIWVSTPAAYEQKPDQAFPVIYTPDGNAAALTAAGLANAGAFDPINPVQSSIQVSVGYTGEDIARALAVRARDLLPPGEFLPPDVERDMPQYVAMGILDQAGADLYLHNLKNPAADRFLAFLADELHPFIAANYRVQADDVGLFGHSYGGLFATYAALQPTSVFRNFGASSPGIALEKSAVFRMHADAVANGGVSERRLLMMCATRELTVPSLYQPLVGGGTIEFIRMASATPLKGLQFSSRLIEHESHVSVYMPAMFEYLRQFYPAKA